MPSQRARSARRAIRTSTVGAIVAVATIAAVAAPVGIAAEPPPPTQPTVPTASPSLGDEAIDAAIDGLNAYLSRNVRVDEITEPCPILTVEELGWYLSQHGLTANLANHSIGFSLVEEYGNNPALYCGGDLEDELAQPDPTAPISAGLEATYLLGPADLTSVLAAEEGAVVQQGGPEIGGEIGGWCFTRAVSVCLMHWFRNELLISLFIGGPPNALTQEQAVAVLAAFVPEAVTNLGAALDEPQGSSPSTNPPLPPLPGTTSPSPTSATTATTTAPPPSTGPTTATPTTPPPDTTGTTPTTTLGKG
jgi:hypothetical protein